MKSNNELNDLHSQNEPRNRGKLTGQKPPLLPKHVWAIRSQLQLTRCVRDLALFNLAIDSKLRACDLVTLRVRDVCHSQGVASRAMIMQRKTQTPVQFELTKQTQEAILAWIRHKGLTTGAFLFPSRVRDYLHYSTRQYARLVSSWVSEIGLDPTAY